MPIFRVSSIDGELDVPTKLRQLAAGAAARPHRQWGGAIVDGITSSRRGRAVDLIDPPVIKLAGAMQQPGSAGAEFSRVAGIEVAWIREHEPARVAGVEGGYEQVAKLDEVTRNPG